MVVPVDTHIRLIVTANDVIHSFAVPSLGLKLDCTPGRLNQASILVDRTGNFYGQCSEICLWLGIWINSGKIKILLTFPTSRPTVSYDVLLSELGWRYVTHFSYWWYILMCWFSTSHAENIKQTRYVHLNVDKNNVELKPFDGSLTRLRYYGGLSQKFFLFLHITYSNGLNRLDLQIKNILKQEGILVSSYNIICRVTGIRNTLFKSVNSSKLGNSGFFLLSSFVQLRLRIELSIATSTLKLFCLLRIRPKEFKWYKSSWNYVKLLTFLYLSLFNIFIIFLSLMNRSKNWSNLFLIVLRGQDGHQVCVNLKRSATIQNWPAYRICKNGGRSKLYIRTRGYATSVTSRPSLDTSLTQSILKQFEKKEWLTAHQQKELTMFIEKSQHSLAEISKKEGINSRILRLFFEKFIHSLLFQVFAIESLTKYSLLLGRGARAGNKTNHPGVDSLVLKNTFESKFDLLKKLKKFRTNKILPLKRIYITKNNNEKILLSVPSIVDRATQQLVLLLLEPIIEVHSDIYSFGFRKGRNPIMAIGTLQKNLQRKPNTMKRYVDIQYIWNAEIKKCFDLINNDWLLANVPIPPKYLFLLKGWLKAGFIEFNSGNITAQSKELDFGIRGIISPLLMNFTLNGMETILEEAKVEFNNNTRAPLPPTGAAPNLQREALTTLRYSAEQEIDGWRLAGKAVSRLSKDRIFKERAISCKLVRFADDFIVISGSERLLRIIQSKMSAFLSIRGLEINPDKSRTLKFGVNTPFQFLGYTFSYLLRTKHIKSSFLHPTKPEYRLEGRPRLFVYPSTNTFNQFKRKLIIFFRNHYNLTAYKLIALLNPMISEWINYYSFSNAGGTLSSLKAFLYKRLKIWLIKKHPKASIVWLMKHYMLFGEIGKQHNLDNKTMNVFKIKTLNHESLRTNKWNFFGLAFKDDKGQQYDIPRLNILKWPTNIKNIVLATVLAPSRSLLKTNFYTNKTEWLDFRLKQEALHSNKSVSLFYELWKREMTLCYFCKYPLELDLQDNIVIHHKDSWSETRSNKKENLALVHESCHYDWLREAEAPHARYAPLSIEGKILRKTNQKEISTKVKFSKNRTKLANKKVKYLRRPEAEPSK